MVNGILVVNKEKNMTSFDIVAKIKKHFNTKKVGHAGTLDPMATGVLIILLNEATKLSNYLLNDNKEYEARICLGKSTTTEDAEGEVIEDIKAEVTDSQVDEILCSIKGRLNQIPPMYSAIKQDGVPLYKLARKGIEVKREAREVEIIEINRTSPLTVINDNVYFDFKAKVSKGTYIRTLCTEIGRRLNLPAHMDKLNRISSGMFKLEDSYKLNEILNDDYKIVSMVEATKNYCQIETDDYLEKKVTNGMKISFNDVASDENIIVFVHQNVLRGIYEKAQECYKAVRIWK